MNIPDHVGFELKKEKQLTKMLQKQIVIMRKVIANVRNKDLTIHKVYIQHKTYTELMSIDSAVFTPNGIVVYLNPSLGAYKP